jgi:nucleotide-binding universal stress UspA family protein
MIKDILVHLEGTDQDEVRLRYADNLAVGFEAYLIGFYANLIPQIMLAGDGGMLGVDMAMEVEDEAREHGRQALARIEKLMDHLSSRHLLKHHDIHTEIAGQSLASEARLADLFIATRPYGHDREGMTASLIESVLFDSGRPCLFVPPNGRPHSSYETIILAWKDSRQASRAVASAMPFLHRARNIIVTIVDDGKAESARYAERGAGIMEHLRRHELPVELKIVARKERVSHTLLSQAASTGAELLVMGGYGHSRLREWVLGGTTRAVLSEAEIPVLVGH